MDEPYGASGGAPSEPSRPIHVHPSTVLAIHLLLQERSIDLMAVTEILSGDPGAMICVLRMAVKERREGSPMSPRLSDWIANLDLGDLLIELSAHTESRRDAELPESSYELCAAGERLS